MWWHIVSASPHIDFFIDVQTGNDKEDAGTLGAAPEEAAQPEDDRPLVLLHHLPTASVGCSAVRMCTLTMKQRERGMVARMRRMEPSVSSRAKKLGPSSQTAVTQCLLDVLLRIKGYVKFQAEQTHLHPRVPIFSFAGV